MITIQIGNDERSLDEASPQWITQEINGRRRDGLFVCVRVHINTADVQMTLSTPGCSGAGGGRPPTKREASILDLWREANLNDGDFTAGNVVSFLSRLNRYI